MIHFTNTKPRVAFPQINFLIMRKLEDGEEVYNLIKATSKEAAVKIAEQKGGVVCEVIVL